MEDELEKLGLSKNEVKIYLLLLRLGPSSAPYLAEQTKIKRPTVYLALDNLIQLGLIGEKYRGKKRLFIAEKPEQLSKIAKRMRRKVVEAEILLEKLIPELSGISRLPSEEPKISFHQGMNGIKNVLLDISASTTSWYFFGSSTELLKQAPFADIREILEEGEAMRQKSGRPKIFFITDSGLLTLKEFQIHAPERREIKVLPATIKTSSAIIFNANKLVIISLGLKPFAAIIESREVVAVIRVMYRLIWSQANIKTAEQAKKA